ncbi:GLUG motif-containing protein [Solibacillus sp. FSL K6-1523]|uniref:GLUG motif-containing protein n=1 Tax=Solibacillus sp. FSL K6-1523 TaxID=2921471 RepID=UPI0030FC7DCF
MGNHKKFLKATVGITLAVSSVPIVAPVYAQAAAFSDVPESAYYYDAVHELAERGIVAGYGDQTFKPNTAITRGQLAKIMAGILGLETEDIVNPGFTDVTPSNPYYGAIAALAQAGIINGYEDRTFRANEPLQRNHLAKILVEAFHLQSPKGATMPLTDVHKDYEDYILALYTNGITTGQTATEFDGTSHVTRGQLAVFVVRAEEIILSMVSQEVEEEPNIEQPPTTEPKPAQNLTFNVSVEGLAEMFSTDQEIEVVTTGVIARMYRDGDVVKITFVSEEAIPKESFKVKIRGVEYEFSFNKEGNEWIAKKLNETVSSDSGWEPAPTPSPPPTPPPNPSPPSTISVTVKTPPKETYFEGESLDLAALVVTLHKSNGTEEEVGFGAFASKGITVSPTQGTPLTTADTAVIITVEGRTVSQPIIVNAASVPSNPVTVVSVKTPPTNVYIEGEKLDLTGLKVTLQRLDGTTEDVAWVDFPSNGITTNPIDGAVLTTADTEVIITVNGETARQPITVNSMIEDGSAAKPYLIDSVAKLQAMEGLDGAGVYFKQTADIDMTGESWTPFVFEGHFDGDGNKISYVTINQPNSDNIGFFSELNGELQNVHLEDVDVKGTRNVGGLVGLSSGSITNSYTTGSVEGTRTVGGLVGNSYGSIENSYATGSVTGTGDYVGGLVGSSASSITNSYATGKVEGNNDVGGLVGIVNINGSITNSYATGSVTGTGDTVGGLVGYSSGRIINSYATGSVDGISDVGGLVGYSGGRITNSYATGNVTGTGDVGGLVGYVISGSITNSYYDSDTTGQPDNSHGIRRTTVEMKEGTPSASIYTNWDINIWNFGTTSDYPTLWEKPAVTTPITAIDAITGTTLLGEVLTAGAVTPVGAPVTYQWQIADTATGEFTDIPTAKSKTYILTANDVGKFIRVVATGAGNYSGTVTSNATTAVISNIGSAANPYLIDSVAKLQAMAGLDGPDVYFKQTADIDMSSESWTPFVFNGHFDGDGNKISHVTINQPSNNNVGFFSQLNGELQNVHLEDVYVKGSYFVGGLVGLSSGSISNSHATGSVEGTGQVGGLVGWVRSGSIENSYATGSVEGTDYVGGLVGWVSSGSIENSHATGSVIGQYQVGGLVGRSSGSIKNSYATGNVTGTSNNVGGLVGYVISGSITSSYYDSDTTGQSDIGKGTPHTTVEMKEGTEVTIYIGWDTDIWDFGTITDYPRLKKQ